MVDYRVLGRSGVRVASLALGTDNFADPTPEDECTQILETAMDAGINAIEKEGIESFIGSPPETDHD